MGNKLNEKGLSKKAYRDKTFAEKKQEGLLTTEVDIQRGELKTFRKQFDPNTGGEIESLQDTFLKNSLLIKKAELEKELAEVTAKLAEFSA